MDLRSHRDKWVVRGTSGFQGQDISATYKLFLGEDPGSVAVYPGHGTEQQACVGF